MAGASPGIFFRRVRNSLFFRLFLLWKLPSALFSGLRIREVNESSSVVSVPYKWLTRNPFGSTYFASLAMAAELSTGVLAMAWIYKRNPAVSMLITRLDAEFHKKATGPSFFTCDDGRLISEAIERAVATLEPQVVTVTSKGRNSNNEPVADFRFQWSFKVRASHKNSK